MMLANIQTTMRIAQVVASFIFLFLSPCVGFAEEVHFLSTIDGDTIMVDLHGVRTRVRLLCVDAPEQDQTPWGDLATDFTDKFCRAGELDLEYDLERHDRYNRLLAYVWQNGKMLNMELARAGLGFPAYYKPNKKHLDQIKAANAEAKAAARGFFAPGTQIELPAKWRKHKNSN